MTETPRDPPEQLNNEDGDLTPVKADTVSRGDPAERLRGVGQENISARPVKPKPSDPPPAPPELDDDATQMKKIEDAAGTEPSPPGVAEPEGARELPRPPLADPDLMAPRLKLFEWSDGFHTFTVAASSRPKALAAWGSGQDLFATGLAKEIDDSPDAEAAKASPGTVIERRLDVKLPASAPKKGAAKKTKQPSAADRKRVEEAQIALDDLDAMHGQAARRLDEELQAIRARREEERTAYEAQREKLQARLERARAKL